MQRVGLDSRDYMTEGEGDGTSSAGLLAGLSATAQLIIINIGIFLLWQIWPRSTLLYDHFMVSPDGLLEQHRVWTLVTYSFSQRELWHLFWNMVFLYWFGKDLEQVYGRRNLAVIYVVGAVGGAVAQVAFNVHQGWLARPMLGASASVMAVVVATTLLFPTRRVLIWGVIPSPLWVLAAVYLLVDVLGFARELGGAFSRVGHVGHLGGALAGAVFKLLDLRPFRSGPALASKRAGSALGWLTTAWRRRRIRVLPPVRDEAPPPAARRDADDVPPALDPAKRIDPAIEERVDEILRKINREGLQSLTTEEKAFLERASTQYRK